MCNSIISRLNRCKKWLRKCIEIYCQRLSQYNESDDFVIDNLYGNYKEGGIPCERLCEVFHIYLMMYMKMRQEFTDMDLAELQVNIDN